MPAELPWWQSIRFGTTAWWVSMARRQVVESASSALKGAFADLSRGFFRVMGLVKPTVLLGFTLAAYNLDRVRSFRAKHGLDDSAQVVESPKQRRARRRSGTWGTSSSPDPLPRRRRTRTAREPQAGPEQSPASARPEGGSKRRQRDLSRVRRRAEGLNTSGKDVRGRAEPIPEE